MLRLLIFSCLIVCVKLTCDTFKNVTVLVAINEAESQYVVVNECIDETFLNQTITGLHFYNQKITILKKHSVRNLKHLTVLKFMSCGIEILEEEAFVGLPKLERLIIERANTRDIPNNVFNGLKVQILVISYNQIDFIRNMAFANMKNLLTLFANGNNIHFFNREWFADSRKLDVISLSKNKLHLIPRRAFYDNKKLTEINLSINEITVIEDDAFEGLVSLTYLDLSFNHLKILSKGIFPKGLYLKQFNVAANDLNYLPNNFLEEIKIHVFRLYGNPWLCPCYNRLESELRSKNVYIDTYYNCRDTALCVAPKIPTKECPDEYDRESTKHYYQQLIPLKSELEVKYCIRFD